MMLLLVSFISSLCEVSRTTFRVVYTEWWICAHLPFLGRSLYKRCCNYMSAIRGNSVSVSAGVDDCSCSRMDTILIFRLDDSQIVNSMIEIHEMLELPIASKVLMQRIWTGIYVRCIRIEYEYLVLEHKIVQHKKSP